MARIGVQVGRQVIVLDRIAGEWVLWLSHNADMSQGTMLMLHNDGSCERLTINPDGSEDTWLIAPGI